MSVQQGEDPLVVMPLVAHRTLEMLSYQDSRYFPKQTVFDARWDIVRDEVQAMALKMHRHVLAEKLAENEYTDTEPVSFPSSPWQFFKERHQSSWWLDWLVSRRPVHYDRQQMSMTVKVDRYLSYPEKTLVDEKMGKPVIYESVKYFMEGPRVV